MASCRTTIQQFLLTASYCLWRHIGCDEVFASRAVWSLGHGFQA